MLVNKIVPSFGVHQPESFIVMDEKGKWVIDLKRLLNFLQMEGFYKIENKGGGLTFVYVDFKFVSPVTTSHIKDYIVSYLKSLPSHRYLEVFISQHSKITDRFLELLETIKLDLVRDTKDRSYIFFNNCYIEISSGGFEEKNYNELSGLVWYDQIIERDFSPTSGLGIFEQFISNAGGSSLEKRMKGNDSIDSSRVKSLKSAIGYLLHNFKDPALTKAVIFNDAALGPEGSANGGTGKSLVGKAIGHVRNLLEKDGKHLKGAGNFFFQDVEQTTQVIFYDDVSPAFDFTQVYNALTGNLHTEKKYRDKIIIPFAESPKILISTNYVLLNTSDDSSQRRIFEFEFSDYYSSKFTPADEFGHLFFQEWDDIEWDRFYLFMIECLRLFLSEGLIECPPVNLTEKKIIYSTSLEFFEFAEALLETGVEYEKSEVQFMFLDEFPESKVSPKQFYMWMEKYCEIKGWQFSSRRSNGRRFVKFDLH